MINFTYENQGTNTYLVYKIQSDDTIDTLSLGMLTNNKITGLAMTMFSQMDTEKFLKYNISAKVSVRQFFNGAVNKKRLIGVFEGIINGLLVAEDYMIDANAIVLDLDYIFVDVTSFETLLVCLPIQEKENTINNLGMFFKNIMFSTQFDQTESCDHVVKIINFLNGSVDVSLHDFKILLNEIKNSVSGVHEAKQQPVQKSMGNLESQPSINSLPTSVTATKPVTVQPSVAVTAPPVQKNHDIQIDAPADNGKKISMLDLLMHYNRENVELYKAQKTTKKSNNSATTVPTKKSGKKQKDKSVASAHKNTPTPGFAIPGRITPAPGFAVPGQVSPASATKAKQETVSQVQSTPNVIQRQHSEYSIVQNFQEQSMDFGETAVLDNGLDETMILDEINKPNQATTPYLIRAKNQEKIMLNKSFFRVGKERSYVDYCIGDNMAISRSHANFIAHDGTYFVVDTNSTNHTYVNGERIQSSVETAISHGDTIRLANEEFEFRLY